MHLIDIRPSSNKYTRYFTPLLKGILACILFKYSTKKMESNVGLLLSVTILVLLCFYLLHYEAPKKLLIKLLYSVLKSIKFSKSKFSTLRKENFKYVLLAIIFSNFFINLYIIHKIYNYFYVMIPKSRQYYEFIDSIKRFVLTDPLTQNEFRIKSSFSLTGLNKD
jgi:hypothetical protein